ncbi:MAG: hypothetical protein C0615_04650 [Desulfuromonas sp.]|nr:MAG: hypothetical protein C0615_04650 [Desulfuromonas sp.]
MFRFILFTIMTVMLIGCSPFGAGRPLRLSDAHIAVDTVWEGEIVIAGSVKVAKGATLTIMPGSDISFIRHDRDKDGLGDGTLVIEGELEATGTRELPIRFRSAELEPKPGDWLEIRVDFSKEVHFRYCEIRDSAYTLHAHFTRGLMEDSIVRNNIDGCRLGEASFIFRNNLFEQNQGKAINFRNATVEVSRNIIRNNGSGIFLFETDRESSIHHNNIHDNIDNIRLGDFFSGEVYLKSNWWGSADPEAIRGRIHDRRVDPHIGEVFVEPAEQWVERTGPRIVARFEESWRYATDGFIDANPVSVGERIIAASWDGRISALDRAGMKLWSRSLGDVIDATPATDGKLLFAQSWGRELFAIDPATGSDVWRFSFSPSPADDHRQGGIVVNAGMVLLPAWNGTLYALDASSGQRLWQYDAGLPLRAAPAIDGDRIYIASGGGILTALDFEGRFLWQYDTGDALLSTPAVTPHGPVLLTRSGAVFGLSRDGSVRWERQLDESAYYAGAVYIDGTLFVGTAAGTLWKLDAIDGRTSWRQTGFGPIYSTPVVADGLVLFGDNDGNLSAVGQQSGTVVSQFRVDGAVQSSPLIDADQIVIGSRDHNLYGLKLVKPGSATHALD